MITQELLSPTRAALAKLNLEERTQEQMIPTAHASIDDQILMIVWRVIEKIR